MKASIVECSFGILAFDERSSLVGKKLFPKKPQTAAKALAKTESGRIADEVADFVKQLQTDGYDTFIFEDASIAKEAERSLGVIAGISRPSEAGELVRSRLEKFAIETGFVKDEEEFSLWTHNVTMEIAKQRIKGAVEKRDLVVGQAIQMLDDLDKAINLLMNHLREWYGVHFPELDRLVDKHETYARLIADLGGRENFKLENLEKEDIPNSKAEGIAKTAEKSVGADMEEKDLEEIQTLCKTMLALYGLRQRLESYLDNTMEEVAPNMKALVGSLLGARLIAISGGLSNFARKPASTIQVLGAEKALFRSLKTGTRPPKHGLIFQHTLLHDAKRWQRGKIARAVAGKLAIAARTDAYGHRDISNQLKASLDKRIDEIREKYAEPPPMVAETHTQREEHRGNGRREEHKKWRKHKRER